MGRNDSVTLMLAGDVMTSRGIDQVLRHPSAPGLFESHVRDARGDVRLAERVNGPIAVPVAPGYVWGDAQAEIECAAQAQRHVAAPGHRAAAAEEVSPRSGRRGGSKLSRAHLQRRRLSFGTAIDDAHAAELAARVGRYCMSREQPHDRMAP